MQAQLYFGDTDYFSATVRDVSGEQSEPPWEASGYFFIFITSEI